jgi:hypothetical protein
VRPIMLLSCASTESSHHDWILIKSDHSCMSCSSTHKLLFRLSISTHQLLYIGERRSSCRYSVCLKKIKDIR